MPIPENSPLILSLSSPDRVLVQNVSYAFTPAGVTISASAESDEQLTLAWTEDQKDYVRDAFAYIATLVNLTFEEVEDIADATIDYTHVAELLGGTTGYSEPGEPGESTIVIPTEYIGLVDVTIIHETGHSLGLSHPFDGPANLPGVIVDGDLGTFELNTELATRMSYNPGAWIDAPGMDIVGEEPEFGAIDIAALQLLFGANTQTGLGDTVYGDDTSRVITIWDNGGTDAIDYSTATDNASIDLRAATLEVEVGGGGYFSYIGREGGTVAFGGYTIAYGVEIENAMGGSGDDMLTGNALANVLMGNGGADMFFGDGGDDLINGGAETDTAVYSGNQSSYTLTLSAGSTTLEDRRGDGSGTDTLIDVEFLSFDVGIREDDFNLTQFGGSAGLSEADMKSFVELYIAYFDRAPDAVGLNFWGTSFKNGLTLEQMATLFIDQDETRDKYPSTLTNAEFATVIYDDVLGRVPDQAGFDFWVGALDSEAVGRDQFILEVLKGAKANPPVEATEDFVMQQQADQKFLSDKVDIGTYYAVNKGMSDVANASSAMELFTGSEDSLQDAVTAIDAFHSAALDADSGAFLMPLLGVLDDPFAAMMA